MKTELMRKYAVKNRNTISKFVEELFNNSVGINQKIEEISPTVKELSGVIKNMSKKIFVDLDVILNIL